MSAFTIKKVLTHDKYPLNIMPSRVRFIFEPFYLHCSRVLLEYPGERKPSAFIPPTSQDSSAV